jgi:indolepyruvate decarboxylase
MNLSQALLHALKNHGACEIFGIPGDFALDFFVEVERAGVLPLYTLSHEPSVGFAADGAARYGGGLGVAAVTYGAGALNMVNAVAAAYAEKTPVVVISGAPGESERETGLLLHHQAKTIDSQFAIYREITCHQARLDDPARAPADIAAALQACLRHSRPVYLELPRDKVVVPCRAVEMLAPTLSDPQAVAACVDELLARLMSARSPVLMAGIEVRRYGLEAKMAQLIRRLNIPVVTSFMGRGVLADCGLTIAGTYLGVAGDAEVTELVEASDALLMMGVILSDTNFGVSRRKIDLRKSILALDGQVTLGYHVYSDISLEALLDGLLARTDVHPVRSNFPATASRELPRNLRADEGPISPADIAAAVNDLVEQGHHFPIVSDVGDCLFIALDIRNSALLAPGYYATMGFGVPAGMGLQARSGERPLILVGDGAFQMTGWELGNCRRYGWDPIVIVLNNAGWEMLRTIRPGSRFNDLDDWDFSAAAAALGGDGLRAASRRELKEALQRAVNTRGRFQLIDAKIPAGAISPNLSRFVSGVTRVHGRPGRAA